jgi:hypothetical protein
MGLKIHKSYDSIGGYFYTLDMGLLCRYMMTLGATMAGRAPEYMTTVIVRGKHMRRAYKQRGRETMDGWSGE